jgi:hypothetical protein
MLDGARRRGLLAAVSAATLGAALVGAPSAMAISTWIWQGTGPSPDWSLASNWNGGVGFQAGQPAYPGPVFSDIAGCDNGTNSGPCYSSTDDVSESVELVQIDDNLPWKIDAANSAQITLIGSNQGAGVSSSLGLEALQGGEAPSGKTPEISVPISIPATSAQTWNITADSSNDDQSLAVDSIATQSALDLDFTNEATLYTKSLTGAQALGLSGIGVLALDGASGSGLDAGGSVSLTNDASLHISTGGAASSGSIDFADANGGELTIGSNTAPDTVLTAAGVTFNSGIDFLNMSLDSTCASSICTPGTDNSELVSTGAVALAGTTLALNQGSDANGFCDDLAVGQTYTLIKAQTLTGTFANAAPGASIPLAELCGLVGATPTQVTIHYSSTGVTATVASVGDAGDIPQNTGAAPAITDKSTTGSSIVAGDTLSVSNGTWNVTSSTNPQTKLSYAYAWLRCTAGGSCAKISGQSGSSYTSSASDVGDTIYAQVTASNTLGSKQVSSAKVGAVLSVIAPAESAAPKITGGTGLGSVLSVSSSGTWSGRPSPSFTYQWLICSGSTAASCTPTGSAGSVKTLTLGTAELGHYVAVEVIGSNRGGTTLATSNLIGRVLPTYGTVLEALVKLRHPAQNRRSVRTLVRRRIFKTSFAAPSGGELHIVWSTRVTVGKGRRRHRHTYTVATATHTYAGLGVGSVTVHLTKYGRNMLRRKWRGHLITATEQFKPTGASTWTVYTAKFKI